jgi:amino acid permease
MKKMWVIKRETHVNTVIEGQNTGQRFREAGVGALFFCVLVLFTRSFGVFIHDPETYGNFDYKTFITSYIGIPLYVL